MRNKTKMMNRFLNRVNNQKNLFNVYYHIASGEELKGLLKQALELNNTQEDRLIETTHELSHEVWPLNGIRQNLNLKSQKRRAKRLKDDFKISLEAIDALNCQILDGYRFVYQNKTIDSKFLEVAKSVIDELDEFTSSLKIYLKKYKEKQ